VGVGDVLPDMRRAAPTNLAFVGERAREAIPAELRAADVLLHPGRREGLPKAVLEALASGVPVVAFPEWRPEALLASGAGIVGADEAEMVRALAALRDDPPRRERMGAAARRVAEGFGWDSVAARWASLFATAARRR
jgi:glycosyltransferase involved in cell wall biosynthesis